MQTTANWQTKAIVNQNLQLTNGPWLSPNGQIPLGTGIFGYPAFAGASFSTTVTGFDAASGPFPPSGPYGAGLDLTAVLVGVPIGTQLVFSCEFKTVAKAGLPIPPTDCAFQIECDGGAIVSNTLFFSPPAGGNTITVSGVFTTTGIPTANVYLVSIMGVTVNYTITFQIFNVQVFALLPNFLANVLEFSVNPQVYGYTLMVLNPDGLDNGTVLFEFLNGGVRRGLTTIKYGNNPPLGVNEIFVTPPTEIKIVAAFSQVNGAQQFFGTSPIFVCFDWSGNYDTIRAAIAPGANSTGLKFISNLVIGVLQKQV